MRLAAAAVLSLLLSGCGGVTYPDRGVTDSIIKLLAEEYSITDVAVERNGGSLWLHIPVESIFTEEYEIDEAAMDKIRNVSFVATRVLLSSDADISFVCVYACGEDGLELRMIRHIQDISMARMWYISNEDLHQRSDVSFDYNPVVSGKKAVSSMAGADRQTVGENIISETRAELLKKIPIIEEITVMKSLRTDDNKALIYAETDPDARRSLFLADTEFSDIFKSLMLLLRNVKSDDSENKLLDGLSFPVISEYWDIDESEVPLRYEFLGNPDNWLEQNIYSRSVVLNEFIAEQIERMVQGRFEKNLDKWDIAIEDLEVFNSGQSVQVIRRVTAGEKARYEVDPDHEIALIVSRVVRNYEADDKGLIIRDSLWNTVREVSSEELASIKHRKLKRIRRDDDMSLADLLVSMLLPDYAQNAPEED